MNIQKNTELKQWNTWKVGGSADFFCQPINREELYESLEWAKERALPATFLSGGSNVLISDQGVKGLVISLRKLDTLKVSEEKGQLFISAEPGVKKADLMRIFLQRKLPPALFLCGLPGDVGGGVVMNAGVGSGVFEEVGATTSTTSFPSEFKDIVEWIKVIPYPALSEKKTVIPAQDIEWGYRFTKAWGPGVIYEVGMSWPLRPWPRLPVALKKIALKRSLSQPLLSASCGSVFKNPLKGKKAGALIELCGLKGVTIGSACVSEKHANFIINTGSAVAQDIYQLIQLVQKTVQKKHGVWLEPEVRYIGQF